MTEQLAEMTAAIAKAEIAMKAAAWQLEKQTEDIAMLRKALFELAYVAEENGPVFLVFLCCWASQQKWRWGTIPGI